MMYDWANSAHSIVIVTVLPIFFMSLFENDSAAVGWWGYVTSISKMLIAVLAPFLGTLGDFKGLKKRLFAFFVAIGVLSCLALSGLPFAPIWQLILGLYALSMVGFSGAEIFYNSFITDVTTKDRMDKVSSWGFALGYIGGSTIPFVIFLVLYSLIDTSTALAISFGLTGIWWGVFTIPLLKNVRQEFYIEREPGMLRMSFKRVGATFNQIRQYKSMFLFLLAYFFFIDGVNTIISMSTAYGTALNIDSTQMMLALLMVQLLAFPFAILYNTLAKRFGARKMIGVGIGVYVIICFVGFGVTKTWHFWALAALVATSQGGIQALSRSLFGRMIPDPKQSNEYFGFFEIFGKFSAIMGPALFSAVTLFTAKRMAMNHPDWVQDSIDKAATPYGVLSVLILFFIGGVLFYFSGRAAKRDSTL